MECKKCGRIIDDDSNFCPFCGTKVAAIEDDRTSTLQLESSLEDPSVAGMENRASVPQVAKKSTKTVLTIGIVCAALMVGFYALSSSETGGKDVIIDENGEPVKFLLTKEIQCSDNGSADRYIEYIYNKNRDLVAKDYYHPWGEFFYTNEAYTYDDNGNLIETYDFSDGRTEYSYNSEGDIVEERRYDLDGTLSSVIEYANGYPSKEAYGIHGDFDRGGYSEYEYDSNGNLLSKISYNADDYMTGHETHTYDENGNLLSRISYNAAGYIIGSETHAYDENGNETMFKSESPGATYWIEYEYNENGQKIFETNYASNGEVEEQVEYVYDQNMEPMEIIQYDGDGNILQRSIHETDAKGNVTSISLCKPNGEIEEREDRTYDKSGNVLTVKYFANSRHGWDMGYSIECAYDKDGNMIKKIIYNEEGDIYEWTEYEYQSVKKYRPPENYDPNTGAMLYEPKPKSTSVK